jgi:hypothetical protein
VRWGGARQILITGHLGAGFPCRWGPGEGQQPEGIGQLVRQQRQRHRQHNRHQQPIGRSGGDRRQPLELNAGEGSLHHPASGQGQAGNQGTWRQLDALSQLAAEAEGGSGAEQRQGSNLSSKGQPPQTKVSGR